MFTRGTRGSNKRERDSDEDDDEEDDEAMYEDQDEDDEDPFRASQALQEYGVEYSSSRQEVISTQFGTVPMSDDKYDELSAQIALSLLRGRAGLSSGSHYFDDDSILHLDNNLQAISNNGMGDAFEQLRRTGLLNHARFIHEKVPAGAGSKIKPVSLPKPKRRPKSTKGKMPPRKRNVDGDLTVRVFLIRPDMKKSQSPQVTIVVKNFKTAWIRRE